MSSLSVVSLALALCTTSAVAAEFPTGPLGVDVSIERRADGSYLCAAQVSLLSTGEVVAAPKIAFRSGDNAVVTIGTQDSEGRPAELRFEVAANEAEGTAMFKMSSVQGGVETQLQQVRVRLR